MNCFNWIWLNLVKFGWIWLNLVEFQRNGNAAAILVFSVDRRGRFSNGNFHFGEIDQMNLVENVVNDIVAGEKISNSNWNSTQSEQQHWGRTRPFSTGHSFADDANFVEFFQKNVLHQCCTESASGTRSTSLDLEWLSTVVWPFAYLMANFLESPVPHLHLQIWALWWIISIESNGVICMN